MTLLLDAEDAEVEEKPEAADAEVVAARFELDELGTAVTTGL